VAVALHALPGAVAGTGTHAGRRYSLSELAHESGLSLATARQLVRSGLIVGEDGEEGARFGPADASVGRILATLVGEYEVRIKDLEPVADLVVETVRYEKALVDLASAPLSAEEAVGRRQRLYRSLHALHTYLFSHHVGAPSA